MLLSLLLTIGVAEHFSPVPLDAGVAAGIIIDGVH